MTMPDIVASRDIEALNEWLREADPLEIADELARLPPPDRAVPFRLLAKDRALEVFEMLDPLFQQELLEGLRDNSVRQLFEDMDPTTGHGSSTRCRPRSPSSCSPGFRPASGC